MKHGIESVPCPKKPVPAFTERNAMMDKRGEGVQIILDSTEKLAGV